MSLTKVERADLRWMMVCNKDGVGLFFPTVRKHGPLPELANLVALGLCTVTTESDDNLRFGYWITDAGRKAFREDG
jgi:hypothetical protein